MMNTNNRAQNMNLAQKSNNHQALDGGAGGGRRMNPNEMKEKVRDHF